ncbi:MAG: hypothetical protein HKM07_02500 [Chlamydiae bacterium]|nr:hypothetical protein [Chlamydiota bacterium]
MSTSENYEQIADTITTETAKKLQKEKGLILAGTGGRMMNDIQMMMIGLTFSHEVTVEEARELLIYSTEKYLLEINNNEKIRLYLHEYPLTAKNIEIEIFFRNPDGSSVGPGKIRVATAYEGILTYSVKYAENKSLKSIHTETFEQALKLDQK